MDKREDSHSLVPLLIKIAKKSLCNFSLSFILAIESFMVKIREYEHFNYYFDVIPKGQL